MSSASASAGTGFGRDAPPPPTDLLIDGTWRPAASGGTIAVRAPATGELLAEIAAGEAADIDAAVRAARAQFDGGDWSRVSGAERAKLLWRFADLVEEHLDELARLEALDVGRPYAEAFFAEIPLVVDTLRHFAGWADKITGSTFSLPPFAGAERFSYTLREPLGVVGAITPWNAPTMIAAWKIAPALAAGNTLVVKPAADASLSTLKLGELALEAGIPGGVLNVVTGTGTSAGAALAEHPLVDKVTFTGSTAVGTRIASAAGANLAKVTLELGGKSPQIVWPDADLDAVVPVAALSLFANQGQTCASGSRIYVHRDVLDAFLTRLAARADEIRVGDPLAEGTDMGSLINEQQLERVLGYIAQAQDEGATLITGGSRVGDRGCFVQPTVFLGDNTLTIAREEVFGPVGTVIPFDDDDEALEYANGTEYGLTAVLWTNDASRITRFTRALRVGVVWVNAWGPPHPALPWLGVKGSGIGEELGLAGLHANTRLKTVNLLSAPAGRAA
ncbi:aldehyde dehydrogenase family protein [Leucobacter soli]|uniref:NAD/NADP-dependent betaine aldehyde dehydrogenase n=1 Tax=Leucobacter soli TaxID=2812850 RepID=A0A916NP49_9MICO|nr:aldehyde dehydrogenase family protein [Leucobacter soli]CAG7612021.1 NAD/NADP-dependent betaine aldehyde dehydrogenase [Leucobacter soli]